MKRKILKMSGIAVIFGFAFWFASIGCDRDVPAFENQKRIFANQNFSLYASEDGRSFSLNRDSKTVIYVEKKDGIHSFNFFINGHSVLWVEKEEQKKRSEFFINNERGEMKRAYLDDDGDGFWDKMIDRVSENIYLMQNGCWERKELETGE